MNLGGHLVRHATLGGNTQDGGHAPCEFNPWKQNRSPMSNTATLKQLQIMIDAIITDSESAVEMMCWIVRRWYELQGKWTYRTCSWADRADTLFTVGHPIRGEETLKGMILLLEGF